MEILIWTALVGFILFLFYGIVPTVLFRTKSIGLIKRGPHRRSVALTFDDGPNPTYTPVLLDLLKQYNCKATFFVVAQKAEKYPELVRRMVNEGHTIGIHHYTHTDSWFLSPFATRQEILDSTRVIERVSGVKPRFYRPPFGRLNIFTYMFAKDYDIVLWSSIFQDWKKQDHEKLKSKMMDGLEEGAIFLLHDDGANPKADSDAPDTTIKALSRFIPEALSIGYECVNLDAHLQEKSAMEQKRIL
ncbi:polysaccharide deacetylase family protein [Pseudalkalibacillus sp. SCS-8]|uniref:polysaccharide deacetylase family protein n=1 Tax=Pseudalkalibacillus nanhaiensis TaxID=3115291 RepID=UPI0032DA1827